MTVEEEIDEAGNQWFTLRGASERALLIGGHLDSVPNGGWLAGVSNVMGGAGGGGRGAGGGARVSRWLVGSSAAPGSMADQDELRERRDAEGVALPDALAEYGVDLDKA